MPVTPITDTTRYPVFASKAAFLARMAQHVRCGPAISIEALREDLYRLSNTDTSGWADPTVRHDA